MSRILISLIILCSPFISCSQTKRTLVDPCEGCEAVFEFGDLELTSSTRLPDYDKTDPKIRVHGTVFKPDGKTPASNVILYLYHTDRGGIYATKGDEKGWARRHGYIRGWVKTDSEGKYEFFTFRPGVYPSRSEPAHIHITVLEPDGRYYWLNSYFFDDDPLVGPKIRNRKKPRGGSLGILDLKIKDGILTSSRDIILGKNISGY